MQSHDALILRRFAVCEELKKKQKVKKNSNLELADDDVCKEAGVTVSRFLVLDLLLSVLFTF